MIFLKNFTKKIYSVNLVKRNNKIEIKKIKISLAYFFLLIFVVFPINLYALSGGAYTYQFPKQDSASLQEAKTVIGTLITHVTKKNETFLDIARHYNLGYNELIDLYPKQDPWLLSPGKKFLIPSKWIIPDYLKNGIVINLAELRIYYFMSSIKMVKTAPIGIGSLDWQTPVGSFKITSKEKNPSWSIPSSLQDKYNFKLFPPGPENPLGKYWLGLKNSGYGIHGTDNPWSIGRLSTHGCIRLYPEDIKHLFKLVDYGTPVKIIYEPIKLGFKSGGIYVEIHKDIYNKIENWNEYIYQKLEDKDLIGEVDMQRINDALKQKNGLPIKVSLSTSNN